jgi:hypothetical protein
LPYGDPVEAGSGTTVAVDIITTGPLACAEEEGTEFWFTFTPDAAAPELAVAPAGDAVSV